VNDRHLTEQELTDSLIGAPEHATHLAGCAACSARLAALAQPLALFRDAVSEHALSAPAQPRPAKATASRRFAFAAVAFAAVVLAVGLPAYRHAAEQRQSEIAAAQAREQAAREQADDALLRNVDAAITRSAPPSFQRLEILMASDKITAINDSTEGSK
jgi:hypothetical protein